MEKYIVYVAGAFAVIVIVCALAMPSASSKSNTSTTQTQVAPSIQIGTADVTTNIWDYIRSKNTTTIGDSNGSNTNSDEPTLTIVLD